jgi:opacity protein-like surface antigen
MCSSELGGFHMRLWSIALLSAVAGLAVVPLATAADMPVKAPAYRPVATTYAYDWSGFYLGGHVGYFWGKTRAEEDGEIIEPGAKTNGIVGGVLAGVNWQTGPAVFGLEGDFGWTNARGTGATPQPITTTIQAPNTYDLHWTSHVRGRVGYAAGNWLIFAAGGLAIADLTFQEGAITTTTTLVIPPPPGGTYFGWSIGGGVDYAFTRNIIGRLEYLYDDFGHKDYTGSDGDPYRVSLTGHTFRGALTWKFDGLGKGPMRY